MPPVALTIAGFDPSSGAGVTADLAVFAAHGLYGTACITALTVQSTRGVFSITPMDETLIGDTLRELETDLPAAGIKIGMLATGSIVSKVAGFLETVRTQRSAPIVLDPVLRSSSGHPLLDPIAVQTLSAHLLPLVNCVTPNLAELSLLINRDVAATREAIEDGARELQWRSGPDLHIIVTGGDLPNPDELVLPARGSPVWIRGEHIATRSTHGTGCAFSSAVLASLVRGREVDEAAREAKSYVEGALRHAPKIGAGKGPLAHRWALEKAPHNDESIPAKTEASGA